MNSKSMTTNLHNISDMSVAPGSQQSTKTMIFTKPMESDDTTTKGKKSNKSESESMSVSLVEKSVKSKGRSSSEKIDCPLGCGEKFTKNTITKNGGGCAACITKKTGVAPSVRNGTKKGGSEKKLCSGCNVLFTISTLMKNGGGCYRCVSGGKVSSTEETKVIEIKPQELKVATGEKIACKACNNKFAKSTLKKHGGICGRCVSSGKTETKTVTEEVVNSLTLNPIVSNKLILPELPKNLASTLKFENKPLNLTSTIVEDDESTSSSTSDLED